MTTRKQSSDEERLVASARSLRETIERALGFHCYLLWRGEKEKARQVLHAIGQIERVIAAMLDCLGDENDHHRGKADTRTAAQVYDFEAAKRPQG